MKNKDVASAFIAGRPASAGHFFTDGRTCYSYAMQIGTTSENGDKLIVPAAIGRSKTTTAHARLCLRAGAKMADSPAP